LDSYLDLAEVVLRAARRPLTPRAILKEAFRGGLVPTHLFGQTQHKTLQARLSEDILHNRVESRFYRTDPGRFFLSEFRSDPSIPEQFKDPFHARRRTRDLGKVSALAMDKAYASTLDASKFGSWQRLLKEADACGALKHADTRCDHQDLIFIWAFSVVRRDDQILCYKIGKYRDDRNAFANRKSIGFAELVAYENASLFADDMGISECGLNTLLTDLDLSKSAFGKGSAPERPFISLVRLMKDDAADPAILFIMEWQCPDWFEPTVRRLSLNEVRWIDGKHIPNDIHAFEPWSAAALTALLEHTEEKSDNG